MKKNLQKMTLNDLYNYLQDLDYEASIVNKSTTSLLEKEGLPKDIFLILNNTLQAMKRKEITINKSEITPYEKTSSFNGLQFAVDYDSAEKITSAKQLGSLLNDYTDWEIEGTGINGARFVSLGNNGTGDKFSFDLKKGIIKVGSDEMILFEHFTHILHVPEQGIYLFKKVDNNLEGVIWIRWETKDEETSSR